MTVLSRLMERLSNYAALNAEVLPYFLQVEAFSKLNIAIGKVTFMWRLLLLCWVCAVALWFLLKRMKVIAA